MFELKVSGASTAMERVAAQLDDLAGTTNVWVAATVRPGTSVIRADVAHDAADRVLDELARLAVPRADVSVVRTEVVDQLAGGRRADGSIVWADVLGLAGSNARLVGRYLVFMAVAGVIGCYGVVDRNPILIVGAMALSPDLLAITAIAVALVGRNGTLMRRAVLTLVVGLFVTGAVAAVLALLQDQLDLLPPSFSIHNTVLRGMHTVNNETVVVALSAGVAGMLAVETRASAGVGVAISVTTIPAAAYFGVAAGLGQAREAGGALAVLAVNVLLVVLGAAVTLRWQQRRHARGRSRSSA